MRDTHLGKRPMEDNENIGSSNIFERKRKREEGTPSTGFGSGPAGRDHLRFTGTALPSAQAQEQHKWHESTSEVPASQQVGVEYLLTLRNQLQETHHRSQAVLGGLDQHIAQMQQQAGFSEVPVSTSHQQDTRALQTSLHPPARNEQSMLQHQQEEVFSLDGYPVDCLSDSDHESDRRDPLEAQRPAGSPPARSYQIPPETSLDHRPDLSMRQRDITEGRKPFRSYLLEYEYGVFKSARRLKSKKISETEFPPQERIMYKIYNKFRNVERLTKNHCTDVQVQDKINIIRHTDAYKEAFPGTHEEIKAFLVNRGYISQQQREIVILSDSEEDEEKSSKQKRASESQSREGEKQRSDQAQEDDSTSKRPRIDFATRQYQLHELQQQSKGKELENTDQLKERSVDEQSKSVEKQIAQSDMDMYSYWVSYNTYIYRENMEYQLLKGYKEVLAMQKAEEVRRQQQDADPSHQADAQHESTSQRSNVRRQDPIEQRQGIAVQRHEGQRLSSVLKGILFSPD